MTVPYTFGTATTSIPLSNLDSNFNTPITLGNTSIYLGNTTTTIGNLTLTNVTISSGTANITSNITYATANAVVFTNSSSIGTTSSTLTWNGTQLGVGTASPGATLNVYSGAGLGSIIDSSSASGSYTAYRVQGANIAWFGTASQVISGAAASDFGMTSIGSGAFIFGTGSGAERMRITSAGTVTTTLDATISGLTVGKGGGAVASNTAVGASALLNNTSGSSNTIVGYVAGNRNTTGTNNSFYGESAGYWIQTGNYNTGFGSNVLGAGSGTLVSFSNSVGVGYQALYINQASNNTAVGYQAGYNNNTGANNVFLGQYAGFNTSSGGNNTFLGFASGHNTSGGTGTTNVCIGYNSGSSLTSGSKNVIIGSYTGGSAPISATGSNNIVLSDGDGTVRLYCDSNGSWNANTLNAAGSGGMTITNKASPTGAAVIAAFTTQAASGSAFAFLAGYGNGTVVTTNSFAIYTNGTYATLSDINKKKNIEDARNYLKDISKLRVVKYNWIEQKDTDAKELGFIAQEIEKIFPSLVQESPEGDKLVKQPVLIPMLVKAIQEQQTLIESLTTRLTALENK